MLFVTIGKKRGTLLFRKGKVRHLHIDVTVASRKEGAVLHGFGWGRGSHQRKAFVILWERPLSVPFPLFLLIGSSITALPLVQHRHLGQIGK